MIRLVEARARLLAALTPVSSERVSLASGAGRTLAAPVIAAWSQPPVAVSAMDGYAVWSADLPASSDGAGSTRLAVRGESAAGHPWTEPLARGQAIAIATGAAVPDGADQVAPSEDAQRDGDAVHLASVASPGRHIRPAGGDFLAGAALLRAGDVMTSAALALAAAGGASWLNVRRRPVVALIVTGDELVEPGEAKGPAQIVNANALGLTALIEAAGGSARYLGIARDDPQALRTLYNEAAAADLTVVVGGASVGAHDHARRVFAESGAFAFERIAVKPGKPTWFGVREGRPCLGLPGNPVSALVMAQLLLVSAVARLLARPDDAIAAAIPAVLSAPLPANGARETFLRAQVTPGPDGRLTAAPLVGQESHMLATLAAANALLPRPIDAPALEAGAAVSVMQLSSPRSS